MAQKTPAPKVSPLAPKQFPKLAPIEGVEAITTKCGDKYKGRTDLMIMRFAKGTSVAGVFTKSATASAPVDWCKANLAGKGPPAARLLVVNAGNANAFTGKDGRDAVKAIAAGGAKAYGCKQREVFLASTGVIGEPLNYKKILPSFKLTPRSMTASNWEKAASAIMTTDTFPKASTRTAMIDGVAVTLSGFAKGSGMIAPDMATMLSFIVTDATLPSEVLQTLLIFAVRDTFNAITVDSDTSTSDTVLLFATGKAKGQPEITKPGDRRLADFRDKLYEVLKDLAKQIVRDGEGASKLITVRVNAATSTGAAKKIAMSIANSPLVKTAIAGEDANWGRVVMAVGKAGQPADRDRLSISFGPHKLADCGRVHPDYDEGVVSTYMKSNEIEITVDIGLGKARARVWTCDLTHEYIAINADYRS
jgi:glutamate N-acetyltransferase / amino-acid N-acetyltransferase